MIVAGVVVFGLTAQSTIADDASDIARLLHRYETGLNSSDTSAIVQLYTDDGVFMPSGAPTASGKTELASAYDSVFQAIELSVDFSIEEIKIREDLAFARTISKGTVTVRSNDLFQTEENRELFILRREEVIWLISRYLFNQPRR